MSQNIQDKLNKLRESKDWHDSSIKLFEDWAIQIENLEIEKSFLELPTTKAVLESLSPIFKGATQELINNRNLSDKERQYFFAQRDIIKLIYSGFSLKDNDDQLKSLELEIDQALSNL